MNRLPIPELLAPAGSLEAVRAALANGADAVYLGAERFNARDEGAQLSMGEVEEACRLAHERGRRIYLTLNILLKPAELVDALMFLGEAIDIGIDAVIVQDVGLIRLIRGLWPSLELHGSTQMTVHDASGARVIQQLGVERVVLARENSLDDIRHIRAAVPGLGLETFVHGALCIAYSGQCFMSGMISERSANRGSCAQSCRKDYVLRDAESGAELDRGYLISAKDLAATDHLADIADAGIGCLKVEGRKKRPEYVATITSSYRTFLDRLSKGERTAPSDVDVEPMVQIYSRGFTGGMYGGRQGREYVTRTHPDNRGRELGTVLSVSGQEITVEVSALLAAGDGIGFERVTDRSGASTGFTIEKIRTLGAALPARQVIGLPPRIRVEAGSVVVRSSDAALLANARQSYASIQGTLRARKTALTARVFGSAGGPLKAEFTAGEEAVTVRSNVNLAPASKRSVDQAALRDQFGRLGETPFVLGDIETSALAEGLFLPMSELNHLRQEAVAELSQRRDWAAQGLLHARRESINGAVADVPSGAGMSPESGFDLVASVFNLDDARTAAEAGATTIVLDPFLRHPTPPVTRVRALAEELAQRGVGLRIRTPTIVRSPERRLLQKWLDLGFPVVTGHIGLVAELSHERAVIADYAVNCFNQHTAAELFRMGAERVMLSIELTTDEMLAVSAPWAGRNFDALLYGRPEGMTIEHCVLSAAFDRTPTTCRDLCVQKHTNVELTDPAGYNFAVATDSACRNRLLHSRPVEGGEFVTRLWSGGVRNFHMLFNVVDEPIAQVVSGYRAMLDALHIGARPDTASVRSLLGGVFTRGHYVRAV